MGWLVGDDPFLISEESRIQNAELLHVLCIPVGTSLARIINQGGGPSLIDTYGHLVHYLSTQHEPSDD